MTVVRAMTALILFATAGCDSEEKAVLKHRRYLLDVELTQKRNLVSDLKAARAERARLERVLTGLETDYSDGNLIAAMDASTSVSLARQGAPVEPTPFVQVQRYELKSARSLAPELQRLRDSSFPAFELKQIRWDQSGMSVELLVPRPILTVQLVGPPNALALPNGHWWDGSSEIRADCDQLLGQLAAVEAQLADAGAPSLHADLLIYRKHAEQALNADRSVRAQPRLLPPELPLFMGELSEGSWSQESNRATGTAKADAAGLAKLGSIHPSAEQKGDQISWSAALTP